MLISMPLNPRSARLAFALAQLELGPDLAHAALSRARASGSTTVLNASPIHGADPDVLAQVLDVTDVLVVNRHEAAVLFHAPMTDRQAIAAAASMLNDRFDLKATIITCGSEGAVLVRGDVIQLAHGRSMLSIRSGPATRSSVALSRRGTAEAMIEPRCLCHGPRARSQHPGPARSPPSRIVRGRGHFCDRGG